MTETENRPLDPESRARKGTSGEPLEMADGREWLIPNKFTLRAMDEIRDKLFDDSTTKRHVTVDDLRNAAWILIQVNYEVTQDEAWSLVATVPPKALKEVVYNALIPPEAPSYRGVSEWIRTSLFANGLKIENIPPADLPGVLRQLEATGRIMSVDDFTSAAGHANMMNDWLQKD